MKKVKVRTLGNRKVKYDLDHHQRLRVRMEEENEFDRLFNRKVLTEPQLRAGEDYYFAWYHGVAAIYGNVQTMNYESVGGGGSSDGIMNATEFQLNCRDTYHNFASLLEPEARKILDNICAGHRGPEIEKSNGFPKYYAYARLKSALTVLAVFKGYVKKIN